PSRALVPCAGLGRLAEKVAVRIARVGLEPGLGVGRELLDALLESGQDPAAVAQQRDAFLVAVDRRLEREPAALQLGHSRLEARQALVEARPGPRRRGRSVLLGTGSHATPSLEPRATAGNAAGRDSCPV